MFSLYSPNRFADSISIIYILITVNSFVVKILSERLKNTVESITYQIKKNKLNLTRD